MHLLDAIRHHTHTIAQRLQTGDVFRPEHSTAELHRMFAEAVLRPMLPARFGLMFGNVFSSLEGESTSAALTLIYDALYALPLGGHSIACEYVYAAFDVRLHLDEAQFTEALMNIASFKRLQRAKATAHDVSPTHHLGIFGARYAQLSDDKLNPYLGYAIANEAEDARKLHQQLKALIKAGVVRPEHTPDAVVCLRSGWVIARQTLSGAFAVPRSSFAKFGVWQAGDQLLTLFYVLLNLSLAQIQLRGPDLLRILELLTHRH
ncbi:MAG: hypothetical protein NZ532_04855 [Thermoflexales bacterium]|nr:hypothetical protein [Thermoflexales bacterium]